jgi:hypothetical protein
MPVPKKRKKMEESEEGFIPETSSQPSEASKPTPRKVAKSARPKAEKVERAFDVIDQIEKNSSTSLDIHRIPSQEEQGIHIKFKLDLIRLEDILDLGRKREEKQENSIVIDFTIPYFWNLPIMNEITKTVVRELKNMKIIQ